MMYLVLQQTYFDIIREIVQNEDPEDPNSFEASEKLRPSVTSGSMRFEKLLVNVKT